MPKTAAATPPHPEPIAGLRDLQETRRRIAREEEALVRRARTAGYSWTAIADSLGVSKQAAHRRFGKH